MHGRVELDVESARLKRWNSMQGSKERHVERTQRAELAIEKASLKAWSSTQGMVELQVVKEASKGRASYWESRTERAELCASK